MTDENVEVECAEDNQDVDLDTADEQESIAKLLQLEAACVDALRPHIDLLWSKTEMPEECEIEGKEDCEEKRALERCTEILYACLTDKRNEIVELLADLELNDALEAVHAWLSEKQLPEDSVTRVTDEDGLDTEQEESQNEDCEEQKPRISHREILEMTQGTFVDWMRMDRSLISYLQTHSVLNEETSSRVLCRPSRPEQIRCLIQLLKELGPQSLIVFIDALQLTQQTSLARILSAKVSI